MKIVIDKNIDRNAKVVNAQSTSLISVATLSINAITSKFDLSSFKAKFVDNYTNPEQPTYTELNYAGSTANTITYLATSDKTILSVDKNGTILQTIDLLTQEQLRDYVSVGGIAHPNRTTISSITSWTSVVGIDLPAIFSDFSVSIGPINRSGNVPSGNLANTLKVNKSAGETFDMGVAWNTNKKNPNVQVDGSTTAANFFYSWRNGAGGYTTIYTDTIVPGKFDDGTGGAGTPNGNIAVNKWSLFRVSRLVSSNILAIGYGQFEYASLAAAIAGKNNSVEINPAGASLQFRGWWAVRGGATDLNNADDAVWIDAGKFSTSTAGGAFGSSTTTLQGAYNNSTDPEVLTDSTRGALSVKRGSAADTDNIFEGVNGAGSVTFNVKGNGNIEGTSLIITSTTQGVIFPNMTTTQKNAIASPSAGTVVYDTTLAKLCVYTTAWQTITSV